MTYTSTLVAPEWRENMLIQALGTLFEVTNSAGSLPSTWANLWHECLISDIDAKADVGVDLAEILPPSLHASEGPEFWSTQAGSYAFVSHLNLEAIRRAAGNHTMLHAAALAHPRTGDVIVLCAPSGTGKTTACINLCTESFAYITDETVVIEDDGSVWPFEKPLSVLVPGEASKHQLGPVELGLLKPPGHLTLRAVVMLAREASHPCPSLRAMSRLDGLLALIGQTSALPVMKEPLKRLDALVARAGGVWSLQYSEIEDVNDLLVKFLKEGREVRRALHLPPRDQPSQDYRTVPEPGEVPVGPWRDNDPFARGAYTDAIYWEGEVLVLVGASPCRLAGIGATIWQYCDPSATRAQLRDILIEAHGTHPDADALMDVALTTLVAAGLLRRAPNDARTRPKQVAPRRL